MALRSPRNLAIVVVLAALIVYLVMPSTEHWSEEVLLSSGKRLLIERSLTYGGRSEIGQPTPVANWTIRFTHPANGERVSFEAPGGVELVLLDLHQNTLYLAGRASRGDAIYALNCPNPPFVFYQYREGWKQISAKEFPAVFTKANLPLHTMERRKLARAGKLISPEAIGEINESRGLDRSATAIWTKPTPSDTKNSICAKPA